MKPKYKKCEENCIKLLKTGDKEKNLKIRGKKTHKIGGNNDKDDSRFLFKIISARSQWSNTKNTKKKKTVNLDSILNKNIFFKIKIKINWIS